MEEVCYQLYKIMYKNISNNLSQASTYSRIKIVKNKQIKLIKYLVAPNNVHGFFIK